MAPTDTHQDAHGLPVFIICDACARLPHSAFEEEHGYLASIVHVESSLCLAGHVEREAFAHNNMPRWSELFVHLLLSKFACHLNNQ